MSARCSHCGGVLAAWNRKSIIKAIQEWARAHDGVPPRAKDWFVSTPEHSAHTTPLRLFGSWNAAIKAAGFAANRSGGQPQWDRGQVTAAIFRWHFEHGELPRGDEWNSAQDGFPSRSVVIRLFGSWNAGIVAAGYEPRITSRALSSSVLGYRARSGAVARREQAFA